MHGLSSQVIPLSVVDVWIQLVAKDCIHLRNADKIKLNKHAQAMRQNV